MQNAKRSFSLCAIIQFFILNPGISQVLLQYNDHTIQNNSFIHNESVKAEWIYYHGEGLLPSPDIISDMTIDHMGNIYVTGYSIQTLTGKDYLTVKYKPSGERMWIARYDGGAEDESNAIAVDDFGNVFVTGVGSGEMATIKYDSEGTEQWVGRHRGSENGGNIGYDLTVDDTGNVFVTGTSRGGVSSLQDFTTIKYTSDGQEEWVSYFDGQGHSSDHAIAIAIDDSGYVVVAGESIGPETFYDFTTVKYNPAGLQLWSSRYSGPGNQRDEPQAIAIDDSGNVIVTGWSIGESTYYDYVTIKYRADGIEQWVARYDGPRSSWDIAKDMDIDKNGNVYVTGWSMGEITGHDCLTIKYNRAGIVQWESRYNMYAQDEAASIIVDNLGSVYITGKSQNENLDWDFATIKYNTDGEEEWIARYNGAASKTDSAVSVIVDDIGNIYVAGGSKGLDSGMDYNIIKYNAGGVEEWVARYDGPSMDYDSFGAMTIGNSGNIYVTGGSTKSEIGGDSDFITMMLKPDKTIQWIRKYDGPAQGYDRSTAIAVDVSENVYVTGISKNEGKNNDYLTIKYSPIGEEEWVMRYDGPGNDRDYPTAIGVDDSKNVYVTGSSIGINGLADYATIKYSPIGEEEWVMRYDGPSNMSDDAGDMVIDVEGNIYVTGESQGADGNRDFLTVKYNSDGMEQWAVRYNGEDNLNDRAAAITTDHLGYVYVTGVSRGISTYDDYLTIKYTMDGNELWVTRYAAYSADIDDRPSDIAVDDMGNVFITGNSVGYYTTAKV